MNLDLVKKALLSSREEKYRDFSSNLAKDTELPLLGVRLPVLRKMAAQIVKEDARGFLDSCDFSSIEMILLYGFVLGRLRSGIQEALRYFGRALPHIDSWVTCDTLCQSFKQARKHPAETWAWLMQQRDSEEPFVLRVVAVMMLSHFLTDDYIDDVLQVIDTTRCDAYYYKMGAAWAVATAMGKFRDKTFAFLETCHLDDWTYNKAIQKMIESYRVSDEDKALLRKVRRKQKTQ